MLRFGNFKDCGLLNALPLEIIDYARHRASEGVCESAGSYSLLGAGHLRHIPTTWVDSDVAHQSCFISDAILTDGLVSVCVCE